MGSKAHRQDSFPARTHEPSLPPDRSPAHARRWTVPDRGPGRGIAQTGMVHADRRHCEDLVQRLLAGGGLQGEVFERDFGVPLNIVGCPGHPRTGLSGSVCVIPNHAPPVHAMSMEEIGESRTFGGRCGIRIPDCLHVRRLSGNPQVLEQHATHIGSLDREGRPTPRFCP